MLVIAIYKRISFYKEPRLKMCDKTVEPVFLNLKTYDKINQSVHPDVIDIGYNWNFFRYWMVLTPYPFGSVMFENPSLYVSEDGINWQKHNKRDNRIVKNKGKKGDYNSDPCLLFNYSEEKLICYYRETIKSKEPINYFIKCISSVDGINWSNECTLLSDKYNTLLSPSVLYIGNHFVMHTVNSGVKPHILERRDSVDGINWSLPIKCTIIGLPPEIWPWHLDTFTNDLKIGILLNTINVNNNEFEIYYGEAIDSVKFEILYRVIYPIKDEYLKIYKSSLLNINNNVYIYYSIQNQYKEWRTAIERISLSFFSNSDSK